MASSHARMLGPKGGSIYLQGLPGPPHAWGACRKGCSHALAAAQAHSSVRKACMVSVTPHVRVLPTCEDNAFSMEPALLEAAIKEDLAAGARTCCHVPPTPLAVALTNKASLKSCRL